MTTMTDFSHDGGLWTARILGALAGSVISLAYLLPQGRREAAVRFLTGVACGLIFGEPAGLWIAARLGIDATLPGGQMLLAGSAATSLCAWWGLGVLARIATRWGGKAG